MHNYWRPLWGQDMCSVLTDYGWRVVLGEIVCHIVFSRHTIYQKFSFSGSVSDPVTSRVYGSWTPLADAVIEKSVLCGAVCHCWGGWLGVAHFYERHAHFCASLIIYKKGSWFCFHFAGNYVSRGCEFDMNRSIEWRLLHWDLVIFRWLCD